MRLIFPPLSVFISVLLAAGSTVRAQTAAPVDSAGVQELHLQLLEGDHEQSASGKNSSESLTVIVTDGQGAPVPGATVLFHLPSDPPTGVFSDGSRVSILYTDMDGRASVRNIRWGSEPGSVVIRITASKGTVHAGLLVEHKSTASGKATESDGPVPAAPAAPVPQPGQPQAQAKSQPAPAAALAASAALPSPSATPSELPAVVITNKPDRRLTGATAGAGSKKKWIWIGLGTAAAVGAVVAFTGGKGSASSGTGSSSTTTIGTPVVSIGHP